METWLLLRLENAFPWSNQLLADVDWRVGWTHWTVKFSHPLLWHSPCKLTLLTTPTSEAKILLYWIYINHGLIVPIHLTCPYHHIIVRTHQNSFQNTCSDDLAELLPVRQWPQSVQFRDWYPLELHYRSPANMVLSFDVFAVHDFCV